MKFAGRHCGRGFTTAWVAVMACVISVPAVGADLYQEEVFRPLIADRRAAQPGDTLTVLIYENSSAGNTADTSTKTGFGVRGEVETIADTSDDFRLGLGDDYAGRGQIKRSGNMLAQLSVTVTSVLPNGDLMVSGDQNINVNGEKTLIRISGRVRPTDIGQSNTVLSSRLANAHIDYVGDGFVTDRTRPGLIPKILAWLHLW